MLDIIYPLAMREKDKVVNAKYNKCMAAWKQWERVWQMLNTDLVPGTRQARAKDCWLDLCGFIYQSP